MGDRLLDKESFVFLVGTNREGMDQISLLQVNPVGMGQWRYLMKWGRKVQVWVWYLLEKVVLGIGHKN